MNDSTFTIVAVRLVGASEVPGMLCTSWQQVEEYVVATIEAAEAEGRTVMGVVTYTPDLNS